MPRVPDLIFRGAFFVGAVFLVFLLGSWVAWKEVAVFRDYLRPAFIGIVTLVDRFNTPPPEKLRRVSVGRETSGVTSLDRSRAAAGLTLVVVGESASLIELDGTVRHSWRLDYERIRDGKALLSSPPRADRLYWRPARVFPNGDLMVLVDLKWNTPEGLALVRMDRNSRPLWVFHGHVHHDFDIAPDGRIIALGMGLRTRAPAALRKLGGPMIDERLLVLSSDGTLLREISILDAFANSIYKTLVERTAGVRRYEKGDYLHSNNVDIVDAATAARFPFAKEGQVLLSLRELNALAVIDVERETIVWARQGEWVQQHDPDFLENGNLLIYDNQGDYQRGGRTRVIEYNPRTSAIVWQYPGAGGRDLWSPIRGDQQRLPNDNVLINDFGGGRLLEVTRGGEVVWEYRCLLGPPGDERQLGSFYYANRYAPGQLQFAFNEGRVAAP